METRVEEYKEEHLGPIVKLSLRAWAPVFASMKEIMDPAVFNEFFPDWREEQAKSVTDACTGGDCTTWVAIVEETVAGFVAIKFDAESKMGEIYMIAVDPDQQQKNIGSKLSDFALEKMREEGMSIAMVDTGGDDGHAPARRTYEKAGFRQLPIARYFKKL